MVWGYEEASIFQCADFVMPMEHPGRDIKDSWIWCSGEWFIVELVSLETNGLQMIFEIS